MTMFSDSMMLGGGTPPGQIVFSGPTSTSWVVPAGVTAISAVTVGKGGASVGGGAGGGALSYSNGIAVTPGESLTIIIDGTSSRVQRSSTILISAVVGVPSGAGGAAASGVGDTKFSGGAQGGSGGNGGGAAGYTANGGLSSGSTSTGGGGGVGLKGGTVGGAGATNAGPGAGGSGGADGGSNTTTGNRFGGDYGGGSGSTSGAAGGIGGIRIIWGGGRSYPSNASDV